MLDEDLQMTMPRVAYLLKKFPRLSETFILNEILRQEDLEVPIHVFSRRAPDLEPRHPQLEDLRAEVELIPGTRGLDAWITLLDEIAEDPAFLDHFGPCVRRLSRFEHPRMHSLIAEALYLRRRVVELSIDHIHVHFATDAAITAMILKELGGPSFSITAHAKDIYRSTVNPELLSQVVSHSAFTITVCDANVDYLSRRLDSTAIPRLRRLYNGIPLDDFSFTPDGRDQDHILAVGRLVAKKGFDVLIRSLEILKQRRPEFRATIIGEGEERPRLEELIRETGLSDRVELLGGLDQEKVRYWMKRATLLCLPCVIGEDGNRDALPTVLLEAQATGLPCISTPVTGIPEILDGGETGVLVPQHDPVATATAIEELLENGARRTHLARAGRQRAEECFDGLGSARTPASWFQEGREVERCA